MNWQKIVSSLAVAFFSPNLPAQDPSWAERFKLSGDVRLRLDQIHESDPNKDDIFRSRLRFRLNGDMKLSDYLDAGFQITTGGEQPTSTTRTMTKAFLDQMAVIAKAYGVFHSGSELDIYFGKLPLVMYRPGGNEMLYDSDLTPEGLALTYGLKAESASPVFVDVGTFFLEERNDDTPDKRKDHDAGLFTARVGLRLPVNEWKVQVGGGYNYFAGVKNHPLLVDTTKTRGNSITADRDYLYEYKVAEGFLELKGKIGETPLSVYADYVQNSDPKKDNTGLTAGFKLNVSKEPGRVGISYFFRKLEKDATLGVLTDSDFGGGSTDLQGQKLTLETYLDKNLWVGLNQYLLEKKLSDKHNYSMTQLDFVLNF